MIFHFEYKSKTKSVITFLTVLSFDKKKKYENLELKMSYDFMSPFNLFCCKDDPKYIK